MSFLTGTSTELIYASTAVGLTTGTFTAITLLNTSATMGVQAHIPPDFWLPNNNQVGRGIRIIARGIYGTSTSGSYQLFVQGGAASATNTAVLAGTVGGSVAPPTSAAAQYWELEAEVILTAIAAAGVNSTVRGFGHLVFGGASTGAAAYIFPVWGGTSTGGASPGTALIDTSVVNYINVNVACSASNASNTITLDSLIVEGLN